MNEVNINPFVRTAFEYERTPKETNIQFAYDCRLFYIQKGRGTLTTDSRKFSVVPFTVYYVPMGERYLFEAEETLLIYTVNFDLVYDFSNLEKPFGSVVASQKETPVYELPDEFKRAFHGDSASRIYTNIKVCMDEFALRAPYFRQMASAAVKEGLINILREHNVKNREEHKIVDKALHYARTHIRKATLSNSEIAEYVGYHPYYVSLMVKEVTGVTLRQYIIDTRLKMAKVMLSSSNSSISNVSARCGFNNVTYFNRVFKENFGVTPKEYRKTHYLL